MTFSPATGPTPHSGPPGTATPADLAERWSLTLGTPYDGGSCSYTTRARRADGTPAVLKISEPHREAAGEATALRLWNGHHAARLYENDGFALLIEHCDPGTHLDDLVTGATLLRELWITPPDGTGLETLADVTAEWADLVETRMDSHQPDFDHGLVALGTKLLRELPASATRDVLLHGDFNPGNILAAQREPWLAIDPKPMIGDPAYDPWPLIDQTEDDHGLADRFTIAAEILGETPQRLTAWALARTVESALWCVSEDEDGTEDMRTARELADLL
ncbi:aminoglycoside phosphotransferase family protein [Amycolatopsis sp. NPDC059657]|uniref:aminoglycoside phosphotransferase family protein n=1 Tax=Amycolatopsis sp. NPDC059657 TaxID=3346899 RepID=UPI003671CDEF